MIPKKNNPSSAESGSGSPKKNNKPAMSFILIRYLFQTLGALFPRYAFKIAWKLFTTPKKTKIKERPLIFKKAKVLGIPYRGKRLTTYLWGYSGKIVLLVHGWASGSWAFDAKVEALLNAGYRVVAIDGPAHGRSPFQQTNLIDFGDAIRTVVEYFKKSGGISALVGHSFGGSTITQLATRYRFPESIRAVVLIAVSARVDRIFTQYFDLMKLPENIRQHFRQNLLNTYNLDIEEQKMIHWLPSLSSKSVLFIHDKKDKVIPVSEIQDVMEEWPKADYLITEGLGHNRILKDEEVIKSILTFLEQSIRWERTSILETFNNVYAQIDNK